MPRRPTAFEVSFPTENVSSGSTSLTDRSREAPRLDNASARRPPLRSHPPNESHRGSSSSSRKRKPAADAMSDSDVEHESVSRDKRSRTAQPKLYYSEHQEEFEERADFILIGEDTEADQGEDNQNKPIRLLSDFVIYDSKHGNELISLLELENERGTGEFKAAGFVAPVFVNEEDVGQEDDEETPIQRLRTSELFRYSLDLTRFHDPVYIETQYAWYVLENPSGQYAPVWHDFYKIRRLAQIVISTALENPTWDYPTFCDKALSVRDELLGAVATKRDIDMLVKHEEFSLYTAIQSLPDPPEPDPGQANNDQLYNDPSNLYRVPMIRTLLNMMDTPPSLPPRSVAPPARRRIPATLPPRPPRNLYGVGNIDLAVLRPENQTRTHVTPLIDSLAAHPVRFRERLQVIGPEPRPVPPHEKAARENRLHERLVQLWKAERDECYIHFPPDAGLEDRYWRCVQINRVTYNIGDSVFVRAGTYDNRPPPEWPREILKAHSVADLFWVGRIVYIYKHSKVVHVQYYEHASKSLLQEISDPQELFLTSTCYTLDLGNIVGKAEVHMDYLKDKASKKLDDLDFFCNFIYNDQDGSFTSLTNLPDTLSLPPPENCPVCLTRHQYDQEQHPSQISDGLVFKGQHYHLHDFILVKSEPSLNVAGHSPKANPGTVGQIIGIKWSKKSRNLNDNTVTIRVLGRVCDITNVTRCPRDVIRDEQHLFLTVLEMDVPTITIIMKLQVLHVDSISRSELKTFLDLSPCHFYVQYLFPRLDILRWEEGTKLDVDEVMVCPSCYAENAKWQKGMQDFLSVQKRRPLRALDLFAGVGAFSLAMEPIAGLQTTHAVEISPSAAKTLKVNSPNTVVYNQCANVVLQYAYKSYMKQTVRTPVSKGNQKPLPPPPRPEEIDCIIAGFPCQPHSTLNMFQKADDRKSHLILNLLSWIDFIRPKYCYFENVRGFLRYQLNAIQESRYKVAGGIELGGLKFVVRAMLAMGYQVRIALLQAAHYGTPQSRVRFFLIAAQNHLHLPAFPTPTHEFPLQDALEIKPPDVHPLKPITIENGTGLYKFVTIQDAIEDLPLFDWRHSEDDGPFRVIPHPAYPGLELTIPAYSCDPKSFKCGISGRNFQYTFKEPQTSFQIRCRNEKAVTDIQHFTRVLKAEIVKRVVRIPLEANADYRKLPQELWEWQVSNPTSAIARLGFRPGLYGRLDKYGWFHTTVTNVEPTAKQSWVLHPWCKRVITVRELARSQGFPDCFVFHSLNNDVKTMHRQIGNAVPWPVARALGRELRDAAFKDWLEGQKNVIVIDDS